MADASSEPKTTYLLEMTHAEALRPKRGDVAALDVRRVKIPCPEYSWFLHQAVGAAFRWGRREDWDRQAWTDHVSRPELQTWVAYRAGTPVGYAELELQVDGSVRILCFGLLEQFIGQGLGGSFLTVTVERAWEMGASRVWLTTCSHDHPNALANYLSRGFCLVSETTGPPNPRQESVIFTCRINS